MLEAFCRRGWKISLGQLHRLLGGVRNENVQGPLCKMSGCKDAFSFLLWTFLPCHVFNVLFNIVFPRVWRRLRVGGDFHELPGPHTASWCLGHLQSPGPAPRPCCGGGWQHSVGVVVGAGGRERIPERQGHSGRWDCVPVEGLTPQCMRLVSLDFSYKTRSY